MIRTDAQLVLARRNLQQAESILEANKRDFGHNPVQYRLFSMGIIDIINSMRDDIDAYTGEVTPRERVAESEYEPAVGGA